MRFASIVLVIASFVWGAVAQETTPDSPFADHVIVTYTDEHMVIETNGIPDHAVGEFPDMRDTNRDARPDNPNMITEQAFTFYIPRSPELADEPTDLPLGPIGIMISGAVFFNPDSAEDTIAVETEVFDDCEGHPQMTGVYHYHQFSDCLLDEDIESEGHSPLLGYAFDGFGVYGFNNADGEPPEDLDKCNGHIELVSENANSVYHYHMTVNYPFIIGCYSGVVEAVNLDRPAGRQGNPPPPPGNR